jgi:glutathione S-transferase
LLEKGIPFEEEKIDLATGAHKAPEYKKLQPFGVVPVLDDDGFILYGNKPTPLLLLMTKNPVPL